MTIETAVRLGATLIVIGALFQVIVVQRPDLQHQADIGSDGSNYAAAAQRIAANHPLYGLQAGDRPVPADNPPLWNVPLLSPPPLAVLWRLLLVLPPGIAIEAWWLCGLAIASAFAALLVARAPIVGLIGASILAYAMAVTAWSGNVNAFLVGMFALIWQASTRRSRNGAIAAGALVAIAAAVKVTPVLLIVWFAATRQWTALRAAIIVGLVILIGSVAVAGLGAHIDYLEIGRSTAATGSTPDSLTGMLVGVGLPRSIASLAPYAAGAITVLLTIVARRRTDLAFAVVLVGLVVTSPVLRFESLSMCLPALVPWFRRRPEAPTADSQPSPRGVNRLLATAPAHYAVLVVPVAACAVGAFVAAPSRTSALFVENASVSSVIVRVYPNFSAASFGYRVPGGTSGLGWSTDAGAINARVVVFDGSCVSIAQEIPSSAGGSVEIAATGGAAFSLPSETPTDGAPLSYTSECAGQSGTP